MEYNAKRMLKQYIQRQFYNTFLVLKDGLVKMYIGRMHWRFRGSSRQVDGQGDPEGHDRRRRQSG